MWREFLIKGKILANYLAMTRGKWHYRNINNMWFICTDINHPHLVFLQYCKKRHGVDHCGSLVEDLFTSFMSVLVFKTKLNVWVQYLKFITYNVHFFVHYLKHFPQELSLTRRLPHLDLNSSNNRFHSWLQRNLGRSPETHLIDEIRKISFKNRSPQKKQGSDVERVAIIN